MGGSDQRNRKRTQTIALEKQTGLRQYGASRTFMYSIFTMTILQRKLNVVIKRWNISMDLLKISQNSVQIYDIS